MARLTPPKSPMVCDKHKSGCLWSLYSLFEFRHGNSNRKLLSDHTKRLKRSDVVGETQILCPFFASILFLSTMLISFSVRLRFQNIFTFADDGDVKQNDLLTKFDEKFQGKDVSSTKLFFFFGRK